MQLLRSCCRCSHIVLAISLIGISFGTPQELAAGNSADTNEAIIELGNDEWTAGIPGSGPLTTEQIETWLANPEHHRELTPKLPFGLAAAEANLYVPDNNKLTRAKIELGRQLYFDTRLSVNGKVSCASCHHPDEGYGRHTQFGVGVDDQTGNRNSPVSYNRILSKAQFWDGRAESLEAQAAGPIANPIEMGNTHNTALATVRNLKGYLLQFERIFPGRGLTVETLTEAIAAFERTLVSLPAPFDYYEFVRTVEQNYGASAEELKDLETEEPETYARYVEAKQKSAAMSESAKRGRELFFSDRSGCTACHAGANFTDELYHNLGVGMEAQEPDWGRFVISSKEAERGAFKTPTVRNVALSAPYMHDGSQKTLEEVVEWYAKGGHKNPHLSDKVKELKLSDTDKQDLVAFMREGLTSAFPHVCRDRLPVE